MQDGNLYDKVFAGTAAAVGGVAALIEPQYTFGQVVEWLVQVRLRVWSVCLKDKYFSGSR